MQHIVHQGFRWTAPLARWVHAAVIALIALAALVAPLALAAARALAG